MPQAAADLEPCLSGADIDTLPLLAWHEDMIKNVPPGMTGILRYQQYIFFPVLCFARFAWAQQSFEHARILSRVSLWGVLEMALVLLHYIIFAALPFALLSPLKAVTFFLLSQVRVRCVTSEWTLWLQFKTD
jgi:hypothetical protein